jgi:hypothetical protein
MLYFVVDHEDGRYWMFECLDDAETKQKKRVKRWLKLGFEETPCVEIYEVEDRS